MSKLLNKDIKSLETKKRICDILIGKKTYKGIREELQHIENIANFQRKRLGSKIANKKDGTLKLGLALIDNHIDIINSMMEEQRCLEN
jgi:hypothetical protein